MFITVTSGMSGYFAVLADNEGPVQSGIGRYKTWNEAAEEAIEWAKSDVVQLDPHVIRRYHGPYEKLTPEAQGKALKKVLEESSKEAAKWPEWQKSEALKRSEKLKRAG